MKLKLMAIAALITLTGCTQYDSLGYPISPSVDSEVFVGRVDKIYLQMHEIGPWCFKHRGNLTQDGRSCAVLWRHGCTIAYIPGMRREIMTSLTRVGLAHCKKG